MTTVKDAIKSYKQSGRTDIKLNAKQDLINAEFLRLTLEDLTDMAHYSALKGMPQGDTVLVVNKQEPGWGIHPVRKDSHGFVVWKQSLFSAHCKQDGSSDFYVVPSVLPNGCSWTDLNWAIKNG